jgi:hypothetical protein
MESGGFYLFNNGKSNADDSYYGNSVFKHDSSIESKQKASSNNGFVLINDRGINI